MYWYLNTQSGQAGIFTSLKAVEQSTGIKYDTLTYHFSRQKKTRLDLGGHRIEKIKPITTN